MLICTFFQIVVVWNSDSIQHFYEDPSDSKKVFREFKNYLSDIWSPEPLPQCELFAPVIVSTPVSFSAGSEQWSSRRVGKERLRCWKVEGLDSRCHRGRSPRIDKSEGRALMMRRVQRSYSRSSDHLLQRLCSSTLDSLRTKS